MTKTLSDLEYFNLAIKPSHKPKVLERGSQRDPYQIIVCECQVKTYPYPKDIEQFDYVTHLFYVIDDTFKFVQH